MSFTPENDLERALMRAAGEPASRPDFYRLLLTEDLLVIGKTDHPPQPGQTHISAGENLQIASGERDGRPFLPVFSSLSRLQAYIRDEQSYVALNGRTLLEITKGAYLILNPASEYGKELLPEEVARLLDPEANAPKPYTVSTSTKVLIGQPAIYPHDLINALKASFARHDGIVSAHLVQIAFPDANQPPHPLIGIVMTGDWGKLAAEIGAVAGAVTPGMLFDLMHLQPGEPDGVGRALLETKPFYECKKPFWRSLFN